MHSLLHLQSTLAGRRILVSMIQVLSQLGIVYAIPFPGLYASLLRWVGALELNFVELLPLGCVFNISFYEMLLVRTLALPALGLAVLAVRLFRARPAVLEFCTGGLFLVLFLICAPHSLRTRVSLPWYPVDWL